MILQLVIGTFVIVLSIVIEAVFIGVAEHASLRYGAWLVRKPHRPRLVASLAAVTLWLMAATGIAVWLWAITYMAVGAFDALEPALYFAIVTFTTLGFGDVLLTEEWRLLSGLAAANGLLMFGLSTAFLVEFLVRVRRAQTESM